ncbi:MAG: hypothetical protein IPJ65_27680 [Archangiaceae bacterium]|nr:hypothetical protein [Archangiaceae bacterium]
MLRAAALGLFLSSFAAFADEGDAGSGGMVIEEFTPVVEVTDAGGPAPAQALSVESFDAPPPSSLSARVYGRVGGFASVDTRFDSPPRVDMAENVAELRLKALLGVDVKVTDRIRVVLEGKAQLRGATQRDFDRTKGFFEAMLGDAFVDLYTSKVDLRVGNQRIALGANAGLAPADALNPRDLRESFVAGEPEDALLPVFAIRARGELGKVSLTAAYAPFFTPSRYFVFGQDEALLQPGAEQSIENRRLDPSIEDYVQDRILETRRPAPLLGDLALRAVSTGEWKVGASWVWVNEKLPRVTLDPELSALLAARAAGTSADPALQASVANRLQAGETLYQGDYLRQHIFSAELSKLLGPGQLDVDVSFSPRQTFFDASFAPLSKASVSWVVGYSQATDSPLTWGVTYFGMAVPDVKANEQLFLVEPATAVGVSRIAWLHLVAGFIGYPFFDKRLDVSVRAAFEVVQRSFALAPKVAWKGIDGLELWLAAEFQEGNPYSPFGYFSRNDKVLLGATYTLF